MIEKVFDFVDSGSRILAVAAVTMAALIIILPAIWIILIDPPNVEFAKARQEALRRQQIATHPDFDRWINAGER